MKDEKQKIREEFLKFLVCYFGVTRAAIAEKTEQLGLDFRKMHDQAKGGGVIVAGKTSCVAVSR